MRYINKQFGQKFVSYQGPVIHNSLSLNVNKICFGYTTLKYNNVYIEKYIKTRLLNE